MKATTDDETKKRVRAIGRELAKLYPDSKCSLNHDGPLQLLIATILSAQCTDERVNKVTPDLFAKYPTVEALASANQADLERVIQSTGFYRNKAKNIRACCARIVEKHGGQVPGKMEDLLELAGVARKTANVVLGNAFGVPGMVVDTHVSRLSRRMGLTINSDPVKIERDLCALFPPKDWTPLGHRMIDHGRNVCTARKALCEACALNRLCPKVGVAHDPVR